MLSLQSSRRESEQCTPNILPCRIQHNGPAKVTKRFWSPSQEQDGSKIAYFRGRKLRGKTVTLPAGYRGVAATSPDRTLPKVTRQVPTQSQSDNIMDEEDEEEAEPVKILETAATFHEVTVWGHDILPAGDDPFVKGVEEWIAFAEAIHGRPDPLKEEVKGAAVA